MSFMGWELLFPRSGAQLKYKQLKVMDNSGALGFEMRAPEEENLY